MIKMHSRYSLIKRMAQSKQDVKEKLSPSSDVILFYEEKFSGYAEPIQGLDRNIIDAHELFNMFTADIIKEKTVFIR